MAQEITIQNTREQHYLGGNDVVSRSSSQIFHKALLLQGIITGLGKSRDLPLQDTTFLKKVAFALFSDSTFSNIEFFKLKTHGCV